MSPIRVFVAAKSKVLRGMLVDTIAAETDMEVVGEGTAGDDLIRAMGEAGKPDVLVISTPVRIETGAPEKLPYADAPLKVLALVNREQKGLVYELRPCRELDEELSPSSVVDAIRTTAQSAEPRASSAGGR